MAAGISDSNARAVYLYGGEIYIAGDYTDSAGDDWVCFWQDDGTTVTRTDLASTNFSGFSNIVEGRGIWVVHWWE